jgi:hypothetical protein
MCVDLVAGPLRSRAFSHSGGDCDDRGQTRLPLRPRCSGYVVGAGLLNRTRWSHPVRVRDRWSQVSRARSRVSSNPTPFQRGVAWCRSDSTHSPVRTRSTDDRSREQTQPSGSPIAHPIRVRLSFGSWRVEQERRLDDSKRDRFRSDLATPGCSVSWRRASSRLKTPSSVDSEYRVLTDGCTLPVSICEIRLGDTSIRLASSRNPTFRRSRSARRRSPMFGPVSVLTRLRMSASAFTTSVAFRDSTARTYALASALRSCCGHVDQR